MISVNKKILKFLSFAASSLFAAASLGFVIYYVIYPSGAYFHSDCADTIYWAQASYDSGSVFNPDFGYAATLPFGGAMLMAPFIGAFGVSMTTHHIGMVLFTFMMLGSVLWLCRSMSFSMPLSLTATGTFALVLCSSEKMREIFYEHVIYYSIGIFIICVLLSLFIRFKKRCEKGFSVWIIPITAAIVAFSFCTALDGMQVFASATVPVIFGIAAEMFLDSKRKVFSKENGISLCYCLITLVSVMTGFCLYLILTRDISSGYSNAYTSYSNMSEWYSNFTKLPEHWFSLFGVDIGLGTSIFSPASFVNMVRIAAAITVAVLPFAAFFFYKKLDFASKVLLLTHTGVSGVVMFGYIFGILSLAGWRLSPIICTGILVCFAFFKAISGCVVPKRIAALALSFLVALSCISAVQIAKMEKNGVQNHEKYELIQFLKQNNLTYGYATFWNSQAITVLSDSKVKAINVDINEKGITPCQFQTNKGWFEEQEGVNRYFVLLSSAEEMTLRETEDFAYFYDVSEMHLFYDYSVYVFNSTEFLY